MTKNLDKIIKICKQYEEICCEARCGYSSSPKSMIEYCEKLKCLGLEFGESVNYPDFTIIKKPYITNSATGFKYDPDQYYIVWDNGNVGRLQFISQSYWYDVEQEWQEFRQKLLSYEPLDYGPQNCHMIFDIEHGKKLIDDYPQICKETREKMNAKIAKVKLAKAKEEYEKLLKEVGDE